MQENSKLNAISKYCFSIFLVLKIPDIEKNVPFLETAEST